MPESQPESQPEPESKPDGGDGDAGEIREDGVYELEPAQDLPDVDGADVAAGSPPSDVASGEAIPDRRCEDCGAPKPEDASTEESCRSCGFDPEGPAETDEKTGPVGASDDAAGAGPFGDAAGGAAEPLVTGTAWKPFLIAAGVVFLIVAFAMVAGWSSFFASNEDGLFFDAEKRPVLDAPRVAGRFAAVLKLLVGTAILVGCGLIAFRATAWIEGRRFGDVRVAASRLTFAVAVAALARLVPIDSQVLQNIVHLVLGTAVVVGLVMLTFRLSRDLAVKVFLAWVGTCLLVVPTARLVTWAIPVFG